MKKLLCTLLALCIMMTLASSAVAEVPKFTSVGTGSTGGAYYPIGVAPQAEILPRTWAPRRPLRLRAVPWIT